MKTRTKLSHFPRLFWNSQNRRSAIFELTPGPRSALGAPGCSLISLLIIAVRNFQRFSDRSFVSAFEPIFTVKLD